MARLGLSLAALMALIALDTPASAQGRYAERGGIVGYVHAESRYGTGQVSGPVRRNAYGRLEVRMPGGTWIECGRSCRDTLRRETVDFWPSRNAPNSPYVDGPGYFSFRR